MRINNIRDNKLKPSFGILKFENSILKYEKPINLLKQNVDMQNLVKKFDHKGIDVYVKFSEESYEGSLQINDMGFKRPLFFNKARVLANLSFISKSGKYIDKSTKPIRIYENDHTLCFDDEEIINNFENRNIYH